MQKVKPNEQLKRNTLYWKWLVASGIKGHNQSNKKVNFISQWSVLHQLINHCVASPLISYFTMAIGQDNREREGSEDKTVGEGETTNSDVSNKRRHSGRAATDVTENSLSLPRAQHQYIIQDLYCCSTRLL